MDNGVTRIYLKHGCGLVSVIPLMDSYFGIERRSQQAEELHCYNCKNCASELRKMSVFTDR